MNLPFNSSFPWGSPEENELSLKRMEVDHDLSMASSIQIWCIAQVIGIVGVSTGRAVSFSSLTSVFSCRITKDGLFLPTTCLEAYRARGELGHTSLEWTINEVLVPVSLHCPKLGLLLFTVDFCSMSNRMQDQREKTSSLQHRKVQQN